MKKRIIIFSIAGTIFIIGLVLVIMLQRTEYVRVTFFDIGQGDSILVQTPTQQTILIDGGPDRSILGKLGRALPFYVRSLDMIVLTHPHADHINGLNEVLRRYDVQYIVYTDVAYDAPEYDEWQRLVAESNSTVVIAEAGQQFSFGDVTLDVLYPVADISGETFDDVNDSSVVTRLEYQDTSFLFTGDASVSVEEELLADTAITLDSDYLKVGHHGSRYSSSVDFLAAVSPDYAIIQSGVGNSFGHPHEITLRKLKAVGSHVLRTDEMGDIVIDCDDFGCTPYTP